MAANSDLPSLGAGLLEEPQLTAALKMLELTVRRKLDGVLQGEHLGLIPGPGSEPGEARPYQPGDDIRRMEWSVTARTTQPHVRQMIADRELETWLVVDASASLDFGTTQSTFLNQSMVAEDQQLAVGPCFNTSSRECDKIGQAVFWKLETGRNRF